MTPSLGAPTTPENATFTACFSVVAKSDPNALSRILEPFTKRGLTPSHVYASRTGPAGEILHVDLQLADADDDTARRIANDLRGMWLVDTVLASENRIAKTG